MSGTPDDPETQTGAAGCILIVEDDAIIALDLQQTLTDMGYRICGTAPSAAEAIALAAERRPDIVLMDVHIKGDADGIETAKILQHKFGVSVIYLTGHADDASIDRAKRTEPLGYLVKPVKAEELRSMIEVGRHNRELKLSRRKLRETEERLHAIVDCVPVSIFYCDCEGRVQFANQLFRDSPEHQTGGAVFEAARAERQRALAGERLDFVVRTEQSSGWRSHEIKYLPDRDATGAVVGLYGIAFDVTERERLASNLSQAELDLQMILDNVPAAITSWRTDLTNRFANRTAVAQFAAKRSGSATQGMTELLGAKRRANATLPVDLALSGQRSAYDEAVEQDDASVRYAHVDIVPEIKNGRVIGLFMLDSDVSEIREAHDRIRSLAQRLESVREEERRGLAVTLHDGIAQDLFAMKLSIMHIGQRWTPGQQARKELAELTQAITACMEDTRRIANDLRPDAMLISDLGEALSHQAQNLAERSNLAISVHVAPGFPKVDEAVRLLFFRAAQEALTNVARHAQARTVDIELKGDRQQVEMSVTDDGIGIAEGALSKSRSLGLLGIRERFAARGGGLRVERHPPKGTSLTVFLPNLGSTGPAAAASVQRGGAHRGAARRGAGQRDPAQPGRS